ncbi:RICIN domain-containing protein [Kitasatospora sp. NPDC006697]|uniref:RICIN domain-containing protein n=1 Tax=Kitasatospora sp. NPDC006697 TaxID=3364020 RepID=UPI0036972D8B
MRRTRGLRPPLVTTSVLALAAAILGPVTAAPPALAATAGRITTGGKCLNDANSGTGNGNSINVADCDSSSGQSFSWNTDGSITVLGKCLDTTGGSNASGTAIELFDCSSGSAEQKFAALPDGTVYAPKSGKCLQVQGTSVTDGATVGLEPCDPAQALQQFSAATAPAAPYSISATAMTSGGFSGSDSPSMPYIDKNGQFYYQDAYSGYGATEGHVWLFQTGANMSSSSAASINTSVNPNNPADANNNTVWRCNNGPTGKGSTPGGYAYGDYCDLVGVWVDPDTGWWYGLVHNEFDMSPFGDSAHFDAIDYAVSKDQGATWAITDHAITSPYGTARPNNQLWTTASSGPVQSGNTCLDITGGGTAAGTAVGTYGCTGGANQKWTATNGELVNPASTLCLTASGSTTGSTFTIQSCTGSAAQLFTPAASGAKGQIKVTGTTTECLDGSSGLKLNTCNDPSQDGRTAFPNQTYYWGDGDPRLYTDYRSGYFYVFYTSRLVDQGGGWAAFEEHVARAPISQKMAPSSWQKWYDGSWSTAGVGGAESDVIPADGGGPGYLPPADSYSPGTTGNVKSQVAAGTAPAMSQLSFMNVIYDAYLGKYIGTPESDYPSGGAPQHIYATSDLATEQWTDLGPVGTSQTSWYRMLVDQQNLTSSTTTGRTVRMYCNISCENGGSGYTDITISPTAAGSLPATPVTTGTAYRIGAGNGQYLAQSGTGLTTTTSATGTSGQWTFTPTGDGFYTVANAGSGQVLGVDSTGNAGRAWGATVTPAAAGSSPTVGQQWSVQAVLSTPADSGATTPTGTYRLVNRYSDLALSLTGGATSPVATAPQRNWDNAGTSGDTRSSSAQTLALTAVGSTSTSLNGTRTLTISGQALDDPNWSTATGTQLDTWTANAGSNQNWTFTQQSDGSYQIANAYSKLCLDDADNSTTSGTSVIQWTCAGADNQHWKATLQPDGSYTLTNVHSGLLLTTASSASGALVTQQTSSTTALQRWTVN